MTSLSTELLPDVVTDAVGAWFGAVVRRIGAAEVEATVPEPRPGTGGSPFARMIQAADIAAGVCANLAVAPRGALTADLVLHVLDAGVVGALTGRGSMLRTGTRQAVAEVALTDERGVLVGTAAANHGVRDEELRMYFHDLVPGDCFDLAPYCAAPDAPLSDVFYDADGGISVSQRTTNPWGVVQGALMTTLVEPAAAAAGLASIEDLTARFLASATVGPVHFVLDAVADRRGSRLLRGSIRDRGTGRTVMTISVAGPAVDGLADRTADEGATP